MSLVEPQLLYNGVAVPGPPALVAIEIVHEVNRIPYAQIVVEDDLGADAAAKLPALGGEAFAPGATLAIVVRRDDAVIKLFEGQVARVAVALGSRRPRLTLELKDRAFRLTRGRRSATWTDADDADVIGDIVRRAGLDAGDIASGGMMHPTLVQSRTTDWDFLVGRAEATGHVVTISGGTLSVVPIWPADAAVVRLIADRDIVAADLEIDATEQYAEVAASAWSLDDQAAVTQEGDAFALPQSGLRPDAAADALGLARLAMTTAAPLAQLELSALATARMARNRISMLRGRLTVTGTAAVVPASRVAIEGLGTRLDGDVLVSGVRHMIERGGWQTNLQIGLPAESLAVRVGIAPASTGAPMSSTRGLKLGVVAAYEDDPKGAARVRVLLPEADGAGDEALWATLATPEAGKDRGFVFRPEAGDDVVVGFIDDDPRQPVVLGSVFGARAALPRAFATLTSENLDKGIATKHGAGLAIVDQASPRLTIKTPLAQLVLDDDRGSASLSDGNGNSVTMAKDVLTITAARDLTIKAAGKLVINAASVDIN